MEDGVLSQLKTWRRYRLSECYAFDLVSYVIAYRETQILSVHLETPCARFAENGVCPEPPQTLSGKRNVFCISSFGLGHSEWMGSFRTLLTVSIRHKWAVSKPQGCL